VYLILAYLKFANRFRLSLQQILRLIQTNAFQRRDLLELLGPAPPPGLSPVVAELFAKTMGQ